MGFGCFYLLSPICFSLEMQKFFCSTQAQLVLKMKTPDHLHGWFLFGWQHLRTYSEYDHCIVRKFHRKIFVILFKFKDLVV